jgi:hypothetical protein
MMKLFLEALRLLRPVFRIVLLILQMLEPPW